eukprot:TRINITY_DN8022_c0_g1_i2.p1 TRINITY_DN8022_c0_g1~~TRINITY_DN8022_c0_g1_i2.p1  ORF type:complete len:507 (+),score=120.44 TRINITY_DN8022_c0_g1_i2:286-1806(+)
MRDSPDNDRDDEFFKEIYGKEYTGPPTLSTDKSVESKPSKRSRAGSDVDDNEQEPDPNAVPTDFTSREAKFWEAKSKAAERNWKRKKEEELICKICGESGHYTQGCPSTLGAKKSREFVEKIPVKDKHIKPRITGSGGSLIQKIETDTGCKIRIEDNHGSGDCSFNIIISGPDRLCLLRGKNAIKNLINQGEDDGKNDVGKNDDKTHVRNDSRSVGKKDDNNDYKNDRRTDDRRHGPWHARSRSPRHHSRYSRSRSPHQQSRYSNEDRHAVEPFFSRPKGRMKYDGGFSHGKNTPNMTMHSNKPERGMHEREKWMIDDRAKELDPRYRNERRVYEGENWVTDARHKELEPGYWGERSFYEGRKWAMDAQGKELDPGYRNKKSIYEREKWTSDPCGKELDLGHISDRRPHLNNFDDIELEFSKEGHELFTAKTAQEAEENEKHRQRLKEIHENFFNNMHLLREKHAKEREEFIQRKVSHCKVYLLMIATTATRRTGATLQFILSHHF